MQLFDRVPLAGSATITKEGYLVADAYVARANNIQLYRKGELAGIDRDLRVFRPESVVFGKKALDSAARVPITLDHPSAAVDAKNYRELARGFTGDEVLRDGEKMRIPFRVTDAAAVEALATTHQEFSWGYAADIDLTPGEFNGEAYDASLRGIEYNHLAACRAARGGPELRIIDERTYSAGDDSGISHSTNSDGGGQVATKTITFDGLPLEVTDAAEAAITKLLGQIRDAAAAKDAADTALATAKTEIAAKDTEIATLKQSVEDAKVTPAQLRDAAKVYAGVCDKAKALNVTFAEDADADAIMRAVVDAKMGDAAKDWTDAQVAASFAVLTKDAKVADPLRDAISGGVRTQTNDSAVNDAYSAMVDDLTTAWQRKTA